MLAVGVFLASSLVFVGDPPFYVRKATWQNSMMASRDALLEHEAAQKARERKAAPALEDVQMPPDRLLGVIAGHHRPAHAWTAFALPEMRGLTHPQPHHARVTVMDAFGHFPVHAQTQRLMKQFLRCHAPTTYSLHPLKTARNLGFFMSRVG